jgi:hypothetical protein
MRIQFEITYAQEVRTHSSSYNLSPQWFTGKLICGKLDGGSLSIVAFLLCSVLSSVTEQQPSYCIPFIEQLTAKNVHNNWGVSCTKVVKSKNLKIDSDAIFKNRWSFSVQDKSL